VEDLLEINIGNDDEGFGMEQPLIKGEMSPNTEAPTPQANYIPEDVESTVTPDDNAAPNAAPVRKAEKKVVVQKEAASKTPVLPTTKPVQKPKNVYNGPGSGSGNGADRDNGYTMQGNNKNGSGDAGSPSGNADSYGNTPGGKVGGPRVIRGNRKIISYPSFTGNLAKATIYADIKVSPTGAGTLIKLVRPSTSFSSGYATEIRGFLRNIKFNAADEDGVVTVQFNFNVN
jgi:hypothetical protein